MGLNLAVVMFGKMEPELPGNKDGPINFKLTESDKSLKYIMVP